MTAVIDPRRLLIGSLIVVLSIGLAAPTATAHSDPAPAFIVELEADGSADVRVRSTFDLTTDTERDAFQTLTDDEQATENARARFLERMRTVASDTENATGREMHVSDPTIDLRQSANGEIGFVTLSVTWDGLAAIRGDTLTVTEPFASGFRPDRPLVVRAPDGYEITSVSPEPNATTENRTTWNAASTLDGFAVELDPAPTPTPTPASGPAEGAVETDGQPGFGLLVAVVAVLVAARVGTRHGP